MSPTAAVGFAQLAHAPHLVGRTVDLLHRTHVAEVGVGRFDIEFVVQQVDARHLLPGVHGHVVGVVPHVGPPVLPEMAGEDQVVALAIVVADLDVAIQEEIHQHVAVVVPHLPPRTDLLPERDQIGFEIVSPAGAEGIEQVGCPADRLAVGHHDLRLVGEPARNGAAELLAHDLLVTVERQFDEFVGHALVHQIHVREAAVPRRRGVVSLVEEVVIALFATPRNGFGRNVDEGVAFTSQAAEEAVDRIGQHPGTQVFERHALVVALGHRLVDVAARETARIGVLVVDPDVHVQFAALLHRMAEEREPVVVEILRHHARTGGVRRRRRSPLSLRSAIASSIRSGVTTLFQTKSGAEPYSLEGAANCALRLSKSSAAGRLRPSGAAQATVNSPKGAISHFGMFVSSVA